MQPSTFPDAQVSASGRPSPSAWYTPAKYFLLFGAIALIYLCTISDKYFGLISDGQDMFDTAVSLHEFGELGIGPETDPKTGAVLRPDHYAKYGLGFSLILQLPLLVVAAVERALGDGRSNVLFPLMNMVITVTTALLIALCLSELAARFRTAVLAAMAFAFGTFAWPYISYDFSEPLQGLTLIATCWFLIRAVKHPRPSRLLLAAAGFSLGFAVFTKAATAVLVPSYAYLMWASLAPPARIRLRYSAWFVLPLAIWSGVIATLNWYRFGAVLNFGYGFEAQQFTTPLLTGLFGLLLSSNKGLIFYAPLSLLVPWSLWQMRKRHRIELNFFISVFVLYIILVAKWWSWEGGLSWGPRLLYPILPMVTLCVGMLLELTKSSLLPFVTSMVAGMVINLLGVLVFFVNWGQVVDSHGARIPLDAPGRPSHEYVQHAGKKWFLPYIATIYLPELTPIVGHAWLLRLRYLATPFSIKPLCDGTPGFTASASFPPIHLNFANLNNPIAVSQICSAHLWLWETISNRSREDVFKHSIYALSLELQGNRAVLAGDYYRALDCYKRSVELMPDFARPTLKLSKLLFQLGRANQAQQTLASFITRHPTDASIRFAMARLYELTGDRSSALREYHDLLGLRPDDTLYRLAKDRINALQ